MTGAPKDRLGKGLGALLGEYMEPAEATRNAAELPVKAIAPNPKQPRRTFPEEELAELAASIEANGLLQPLVVRRASGSLDRYELVAGERRLRAVRSLGWEKVPALLRDVDDDTLLVLALVENLQREALNPIDEAEGYRALSDEHGLTQAEIAESVGKDRSTVANMLRLLRLPPSVRKLLESGQLSTGHARALLSVEDPVRAADLARQAVKGGWSVREMERRAKKVTTRRPAPAASEDPIVRALEEELRVVMAARVLIRANRQGTKGSIEIPFLSADDFDRIYTLLAGREPSEIVG